MCAGTLLCVLGFLSAVTVSVLDKVGMKQLGLDGILQEESRKVVRSRTTVYTINDVITVTSPQTTVYTTNDVISAFP